MTQAFSRLLQLLVAILVFAIFIKAPEDFHFSFINIPLFIINVLISSSLFFLMESLMELAAFWAENVWSLSVLLRFLIGLFSGAWLSLSLFPAWSQTIMSLLPFKGMVYIPVRLLMGEVSFNEWMYVQFISMTWILIMGLLVAIVWRRGRILYTGVGI
jgi:ABC-2 type transport system permease protein